jgi:hypothetical protein
MPDSNSTNVPLSNIIEERSTTIHDDSSNASMPVTLLDRTNNFVTEAREPYQSGQLHVLSSSKQLQSETVHAYPTTTANHSEVMYVRPAATEKQLQTVHMRSSVAQGQGEHVYAYPSTSENHTKTVYVDSSAGQAQAATGLTRHAVVKNPLQTIYVRPSVSVAQGQGEHIYAYPSASENHTKTIYVDSSAGQTQAVTELTRHAVVKNPLQTIYVRPSVAQRQAEISYVHATAAKIQPKTIYVRPVHAQSQVETIYVRSVAPAESRSQIARSQHFENAHARSIVSHCQVQQEHIPQESIQFTTENLDMQASGKKLESNMVGDSTKSTKTATETMYIQESMDQAGGSPTAKAAAAASDASGLKSGNGTIGAQDSYGSSLNDDNNLEYQ